MSRRRLRRLHRDATSAWVNGFYFDHGASPRPAPAEGPLRVAFDAGRASANSKEPLIRWPGDRDLPLEVWSLVLADYLRRYRDGFVAR